VTKRRLLSTCVPLCPGSNDWGPASTPGEPGSSWAASPYFALRSGSSRRSCSQTSSSPPIVEAIGDEAWEDLIQWQDKTLRSLFAWHGGQEIDHAGDGFFVAFESASAAIDCAVAIQRALADHRKTHGFSPQLRIGLHATEAARSGGGFRGKGVHQAARIASMAEGGEILVSRTALETEISRYPTSEAKMMNLKGISEPIEVSTIDWR